MTKRAVVLPLQGPSLICHAVICQVFYAEPIETVSSKERIHRISRPERGSGTGSGIIPRNDEPKINTMTCNSVINITIDTCQLHVIIYLL